MRRKKTLSPAEKAHRTQKKKYRLIRNSILLLDCTVRSREKCSEIDFLERYLEIINRQLRSENKKEVEIQSQRIYGPKVLVDSLKFAYQYTIHVSSHGDVDDDDTYLDLSRGELYADDLRGIWEEFEEDERPLLLVLSACCAGHKDLIQAVSEKGCRYCIAPVLPTNWEHAALFSTFFYTYLLLGQMRPVAAFRKAVRSLPELTGKWKMYDRGKEVGY